MIYRIKGITDKYLGYKHPDGTYRKYPTDFTWYRWRFQNNSISVWRFRLVWWDYGKEINFQFKMKQSRWINLAFNFSKDYRFMCLNII